MKRVAILGATGSIGTQTLDVVRSHPDNFSVVAMAAGSDARRLEVLAQEHSVARTALASQGNQALVDLVTADDVDVVVVCGGGAGAILPTLAAIDAGKSIALATKEVLVAAGEVVMARASARGVSILPVDSEHSAIFQCLTGQSADRVRRLILTASGGPFRGLRREKLENVTREEALNHPTWRMGGKITIDSATLMNKALETIEAKWLFGVPMDRIEVLVHPQSVIHSMVEWSDTSVIAQLGWPDMRLPILVALSHPARVEASLAPWDPLKTGDLTFEAVDHEAFPAIQLARAAERIGGTMPAFFNGANEAAVAAFLRGECGFLDITRNVERAMSRHNAESATLEHVLAADAEARLAVLQST